MPATGDDPSDVTGDKPDASAVVAKKVTGDATGDAASVIGALERHISRLETELDALKQAREAERERLESVLETARRNLEEEHARNALLTAEAAAVPALKDTVAALKGALDTEKGRVRELRAERDRLSARRSWWPWRRAG